MKVDDENSSKVEEVHESTKTDNNESEEERKRKREAYEKWLREFMNAIEKDNTKPFVTDTQSIPQEEENNVTESPVVVKPEQKPPRINF